MLETKCFDEPFEMWISVLASEEFDQDLNPVTNVKKSHRHHLSRTAVFDKDRFAVGDEPVGFPIESSDCSTS